MTASDIDGLFALVDKIQRHDEEQERTRRADLELLTRQSWVDLAADARVGVDSDGRFRAAGRNAFRPGAVETLSIHLEGGVDPQWRGRGIGRELLRWQRARALRNIADLRAADPAARELPARYGAFVEDQITSRARLLRAAGFTPSRWFTEFRRPLDARYDVPSLGIDGLRVDRLDDDRLDTDLSERVRQAHNDAFLDHWGSNPHDEEAWRTGVVEDEAFRPAQSFAIVDTTDTAEPVVAYVVNCEYEHDWVAQGFSAGYTEAIGVRRAWRGRGLAKHLLALSAGVFAEAGHPYAELDADADNPSGAVALYESLGYQAAHRATYYSVAV